MGCEFESRLEFASRNRSPQSETNGLGWRTVGDEGIAWDNADACGAQVAGKGRTGPAISQIEPDMETMRVGLETSGW